MTRERWKSRRLVGRFRGEGVVVWLGTSPAGHLRVVICDGYHASSVAEVAKQKKLLKSNMNCRVNFVPFNTETWVLRPTSDDKRLTAFLHQRINCVDKSIDFRPSWIDQWIIVEIYESQSMESMGSSVRVSRDSKLAKILRYIQWLCTEKYTIMGSSLKNFPVNVNYYLLCKRFAIGRFLDDWAYY